MKDEPFVTIFLRYILFALKLTAVIWFFVVVDIIGRRYGLWN
jgi:hypothetical protein